MSLLNRTLDLIEEAAQIPSFSSFEERIHAFISSVSDGIPDCKSERIQTRNILLKIPGKKSGRLALTAHLDKINHFGEEPPARLPFKRTDEKLTGQLDNTAGIGIVLALAEASQNKTWPELLILLSEMEESKGLKEHPHLLRNGGSNLHHGMGAERLAHHLIETGLLPEAVITIDTTPLFKGENGCAVYSRHWEFTNTSPTENEIHKTAQLVERIQSVDSDVLHRNNTNDYLTYGKILNTKTDRAIPSIALEPAIFPYHTQNEAVFVDDINRVLNIMQTLLDHWGA